MAERNQRLQHMGERATQDQRYAYLAQYGHRVLTNRGRDPIYPLAGIESRMKASHLLRSDGRPNVDRTERFLRTLGFDGYFPYEEEGWENIVEGKSPDG